MALVRSIWAEQPIYIGGVLSSREWTGAGKMPIPAGYLMVKNDATYLYVALDLVGDRGNDPGTEDYFWFTVDLDGNRQITSYRDVNYGLYPGQSNKLGRQYYVGAGRWTALLNEESEARVHIGYNRSPHSSTAHRIWEMRLPLAELGVDLNASDAPPVIRFGVRVSSTNPRFTYDYPHNFHRNFSNLHEIIVARQPEANYPDDAAGIVMGGVGLIPASVINEEGYATTDSTYRPYVVDAAFGGRMNLIGNRVTLQKLWNQGARTYKMQHRVGKSGSFAPIRQSWSNYRWNGTTFVLEHYGPDDDDKYPLLNPSLDYSIDDLLLQWQSVGFAAGIHQFQAEFFRENGSAVSTPSQTLTLKVDNNLPRVEIVDIRHRGSSVSACAIEEMADSQDGLQFTITVDDAEGHLRDYILQAHFGDSDRRNVIPRESYDSHRSATQQWKGVTNAVVPSEVWTPPRTCAYQFRLSARPRVTNGYGYIGYVEATRHVTLIKPGSGASIAPRFSQDLPLGLLATDRPNVEGEEPAQLGG